MAIYIKEIYLPEDPNEMIEFAVKGNGNVFVIGEHFALEACNVQEPHGRLIDADAPISLIDTRGEKVEVTVAHIIEKNRGIVKAVVPASEEE